MSRQKLPDDVHKRIMDFSKAGDKLAAQGKYREAIGEYKQAWELVPEPENDWEASTWLMAAIADAAYLGGFKKTARESLEYAMSCPGAIGNAFLHLRLGQVLFDADEPDAAAEELMRAYMSDGKKVFKGEDPKYYAFLKTRARDLE
jgi:tetratricopeptide (TPR) repeat protein